MAIFYKGQRLSVQDSRCTVRYIGEVKNTKGSWLGVEWDDVTKGKHAGEHDGKGLSTSSTAASFIRPTRPFEQRRNFLEALKARYASDLIDSFQTSEDSNDAGIAGIAPRQSSARLPNEKLISISGKVVEEVGFDKIRKQLSTFGELKIVLLDKLCLGGVQAEPFPFATSAATLDDAPSERMQAWIHSVQTLGRVCPKIVELDLGRNLLERWADVVGICKVLRELRVLKLNFNRFNDFSVPRFPDLDLSDPFVDVEELYLDDTLLEWDQMNHLISTFPSLKRLSLSSNTLLTTPSPLVCQTITTLNLSHNHISSLQSLQALSGTLSLKSLSLRSNMITSIANDLSSSLSFLNIQHLDLSSNLLASIASISHIQPHFPRLESLLTSHNPFTKFLKDPKETHLLTIARIETLTSLNYSTITPEERQNADIYYLTTIAKQLAIVPEHAEANIVKSEHPRYPRLCKLYYTPTIARSDSHAITDMNTIQEQMKPDNLNIYERTPAARLITFDVYLPARTASHSHKSGGAIAECRTLRLPRHITSYRLKAFVGDAFGLPPTKLKLIWETGEWDPIAKGFGRQKFALSSPDTVTGTKSSENGQTKSSKEILHEEEDDEKWGPPESDSDEEVSQESTDGARLKKKEVLTGVSKGDDAEERDPLRWARREIELLNGTREVGFWIEGRGAKIRVELG
ncbi:hypothetical protein MMC25_007889 [Agyrium rufum]|nr:hypothetical protein [Agyrium rufum]